MFQQKNETKKLKVDRKSIQQLFGHIYIYLYTYIIYVCFFAFFPVTFCCDPTAGAAPVGSAGFARARAELLSFRRPMERPKELVTWQRVGSYSNGMGKTVKHHGKSEVENMQKPRKVENMENERFNKNDDVKLRGLFFFDPEKQTL